MNTKFTFKTTYLKTALEEYKKKTTFNLTGDKTVVELSSANKDVLQFLLDEEFLTSSQQIKVSAFLFKKTDLDKVESDNVSNLFNQIAFISDSKDPVLEVKIEDKWYPLMATVAKWKTMFGWSMQIRCYASIGGMAYGRDISIGDWSFEDRAGKKTKKTLNELLERQDLRVASKDAIEHAKKLQAKLLEFNNHVNDVYDAWGTALVFQNYWGWASVNIGWKDSASTTIFEPALENQNAVIADPNTWNLPFIRVFSFKHKNYMYVDIENIAPHVFHENDRDKIVLPESMMTALNSIFNAKKENIFGDLFHGRHGGIVVLANGPSGVGKTLTAEVFAEYQNRPLYSMEMSEVGTTVEKVEANLQKIFARAKKWNAVLLFDEADIFLSEREASELERSAIVGIFLRLLDYYEGTFFLTTNRGEGIDKAFKSRVTLYLNYPALTDQVRQTIWTSMLKSANMEVVDDSAEWAGPPNPSTSWPDISRVSLNGRQIRNQVRLAKLMYPEGKMTTTQLYDTLQFAAT